MENLPLMVTLILVAVVALDQTMINDIALLGIAIIGLWNAHKALKTDTKLTSVKNTAEAVHVLSNSAMGAQLKINVEFAQANSVLSHRLADTTHQAADIAAAEASDLKVKEQQALLQSHLIQQAKVDATTAVIDSKRAQ